MNRIFYSSLLLLTLLFSHKANAQAFNFTISPTVQCYVGPGTYTALAAVTASQPGASTYTYVVVNPTPTCPANFAYVPATNGSVMTLSATCCGVYTIICSAWNGLSQVGTSTQKTLEIVCPTGATITPTPTNGVICASTTATLNVVGASSFTWFAQPANGPAVQISTNVPVFVTPSVNTTYTMTGFTFNGCAVTATASIKVSKATIAITPTAYVVCPGSPITFTPAITSVNTPTNLYTTGTATTGIQWFAPAAVTPFSVFNGPVTTSAVAGNYQAILTYTGAAGTCTLPAFANVTTLSAIPVTVSANAASVCPGSQVILSANVSATPSPIPSNVTYTWTNGTPISNASTTTQSLNVPTNYTVNVTYFGCTGTASLSVGIATITPTLSASTPSSCPGRTITLTPSGGISYSITAYYPIGPPVPLATIAPIPTATVAPTSAQLGTSPNCASFVVNAKAGGCVGSATISVCKMTLNTQIIPSSYSVCPNSTVCLHTNNGCGTTNSFTNTTTLATVPTTTNCSTTNSLACFSTASPIFPLVFVTNSDSLGCKGSATITIGKLALNPSISSTALNNSICPASSLTLSTVGGAGTSFTITAPYPVANTILSTGPTNTVATTAPNPTVQPFPYTYVAKADSAGCVGTASLTIGLYSITPILTASQPSLCPGSNFTLTSTGGAGTSYTFSADYTVTTGSIIIPQNNTLTPNTVTNTINPNTTIFPFAHTYTVEVDSAGCTGSSTVQIGLLNLSPSLTLAAYANSTVTPSSSVCPGSNFTIVAVSNNTALSTPNTYSFFGASGALSSTANIAVTSSAILPQTYTVAVTNAQCGGTQTITVNKMSVNNLTLIANPALVCAGKPSTLAALMSNTLMPPNPNITYSFSTLTSTTALSVTSNPVFVVNPTTLTIYNVSVDSAGCKNTVPASATVAIRPGLTLTPASTQASVCAGLTTTLSVTSNSSNVSYTWSPFNLGTLTPGSAPSTSAICTPTIGGTYTVIGEDSVYGCVGSATITVGIDPFATLSVTVSSPVSTVCPGLTAPLSASCTINPVNFSWTPTLTLNQNNTASVIASPTTFGQNVYTVTADNGWGCTGSATIGVNVSSYPILNVTATSSNICAGYNTTLTAFGANSYTWSSASFSNAVAQQSLSVGAAGVYTVVGSNGGGCISDTTFVVGNQQPLTISLSQTSGTTCIENNSPKYSKPVILTASGAQTYVWFPYNPIHMTYSLGPTTTVRPPATTCYTVTGSTPVCSGTAIICVTVIPQFTMNVVPPLPLMCLGDSLKLSIVNISTLAVGPASAFNYSWTEAANAPPINISSKFTPTVIVTPQNTTTYSVQVKDSRACVSLPRLVTVTVLPRPLTAIAIPTINNVATNTVCFVGLNPGPDDVVLTLTGTNKNTNLQFGIVPTYTWVSPYPIKYNSILTPVNNNAITVNAPLKVLNNSSVVTYTLISGYNGVLGCKRADTISIRIIDCRPVTNVFFTTAEKIDTICARNCVTFMNLTDTAAGGTQTLSWQFPGGAPAKSSASIQTVCYNLPGKYNVILTVSNPYPKTPPNNAPPGSSNDLGEVSYVKVVDIPNVTIVAPGQLHSDTTIRFGTAVNLAGSGAASYNWAPYYNISSLTDPKVTVNPYKSTQYILTGYNSRGCFSSDTINVMVIQDCGEMYVPNAFTPNNDGVNDVLYVRGICLKTLSFMVFNRWGEKVFETADQKVGWDGSYKGEDMNTGVFVYRLEGRTYDGKGFSAKGNITLIR